MYQCVSGLINVLGYTHVGLIMILYWCFPPDGLTGILVQGGLALHSSYRAKFTSEDIIFKQYICKAKL